jgi:hypothetical protein
MVRLLVQAGANVDARVVGGDGVPAIAHALQSSKMQPKDAEILQILIGKRAISTLPLSLSCEGSYQSFACILALNASGHCPSSNVRHPWIAPTQKLPPSDAKSVDSRVIGLHVATCAHAVVFADAGARLEPWSPDPVEYDFVQAAANNKDADAALKLVEAGAKWQLRNDQRARDGILHYPPEILCCKLPHLKVCSMAVYGKVFKQCRGQQAT